VGSSLGSVGRVTTPGLPESQVPSMAYGSSKAALNMMTVHYAKAFPDMRINCVDPGYTATDLNGNSGYLTASQAARVIAQMACIGSDGPTGTYRNADGDLPW
jgi:NAD(P)-dependent dehydrogenase (short-subunit alcohol dehydrogenase family)